MNRTTNRVLIIAGTLLTIFVCHLAFQLLPANQKMPLLAGSVITLMFVAAILFFAHPGVSRIAKFRTISITSSVAFALLFAEGIAWMYFSRNENAAYMRAVMCGDIQDAPGEQLQRPQPYLLYVPAPNYRHNANYHNEQGYRGKPVAMNRTPRVKRILCLGGSTTYGYGTNDADQSYPAQLQKILTSQLPQGVDGIEVINGGLPYGTTAELLTHYHFKFHYFRPDLVIINTGGNDAMASRAKYYQPDYSHWRHAVQAQRPLSARGRTIVKSRLASLLLMHFFYGSWSGGEIGSLDRSPGSPPTVWHEAARNADSAVALSDEQLGFTHNLNTLIDMIKRDGAEVLLVPFRINPVESGDEALAQCDRNERILKNIAKTRDLPVAPFPHSVISATNWIDSCHLNAQGCREKAFHIAPFLRRALWAND